MPLYQYECKQCSRKFEEFRDSAHRNEMICSCGSAASLIMGVPLPIKTTKSWNRPFRGGDGLPENDRSRKLIHSRARAAGINPTGKKYIPMLAEYAGDPTALVSDPDDIKKRCHEKGWDCKGLVNVKGLPGYEQTPYKISDSIVREHVQKELNNMSDPSPKEVVELEQRVRNKLMPTGGEPA